MSLLSSANAIAGLLNGATELVNAWKQPKLSNEDFSKVLDFQLDTARAANTPEALAARESAKIAELSAKYVGLRDANQDGALTLNESGLDAKHFVAMDADGDGKVTAAEIAAFTHQKLSEFRGDAA